MAASHRTYACRLDQDGLLMFKLTIRGKKNADLSDFEYDVVVGLRI